LFGEGGADLLIFPRNTPVGLSIIVVAGFGMAEACAAKGFAYSEMACTCVSCHHLLSVEDPKDERCG